jgi:predicted amidophosphoribosyltransferase
MHIFKPKVCECGYDFESGKADELICPKCKRRLTYMEISERHTCPGCEEELNKLFRYPCPKCGAAVGIKDKYCERCGEKLFQEFAVCPHCGKEIPADSKVCPHCGRPLVADQEYIEKWYCPICGTELPCATCACPVCGE